eukprot:6873286-Prorocentrum_lima.AAC.1
MARSSFRQKHKLIHATGYMALSASTSTPIVRPKLSSMTISVNSCTIASGPTLTEYLAMCLESAEGSLHPEWPLESQLLCA